MSTPSTAEKTLRLAIGFAKLCFLVFVTGLAVADIYHHCRGMLYFPDEIYNLDPILTFYTRFDYTTVSQGGHPFDPVLSSGILATWMNGAVFYFGGNLFTARLVQAFSQFFLLMALAISFMRTRGIALIDAATVFVTIWVMLILLNSHELRIINGGELWGILYLGAGFLFLHRSPTIAALVWGMTTWWVKIIYLPFTGFLMIALVWAEKRERHLPLLSAELAREALRLGLAFAAPLLLWMVLIWLRYDLSTLVQWTFSYATFVAEHSADVTLEGLPTLPGWSFGVYWTDMPFWQWGPQHTKPYLIALGASGVSLLLYGAARIVGVLESSSREASAVLGVACGLAFALTWYFALDPTQWGRHLMPSIYVAIGLGTYAAVELWRRMRRMRWFAWAFGTLLYAGMVVAVQSPYAATEGYIARTGWKDSYAQICRGMEVLEPPCGQKRAVRRLRALARQVCETDEDLFHPHNQCMPERRIELIDAVMTMLENPSLSNRDALEIGYVVLLLQHYIYHSFIEHLDPQFYLDEVGTLACAHSGLVHRRLKMSGIDVERLLRTCEPSRELLKREP